MSRWTNRAASSWQFCRILGAGRASACPAHTRGGTLPAPGTGRCHAGHEQGPAGRAVTGVARPAAQPTPPRTHFLHMATNLWTETEPVRSPPAQQKRGPFQYSGQPQACAQGTGVSARPLHTRDAARARASVPGAPVAPTAGPPPRAGQHLDSSKQPVPQPRGEAAAGKPPGSQGQCTLGNSVSAATMATSLLAQHRRPGRGPDPRPCTAKGG